MSTRSTIVDPSLTKTFFSAFLFVMAKVFLADTTRWILDGHQNRPRETWVTEAPVKSKRRAARRAQKAVRDRRWDS